MSAHALDLDAGVVVAGAAAAVGERARDQAVRLGHAADAAAQRQALEPARQRTFEPGARGRIELAYSSTTPSLSWSAR